mmetsp:Transcript_32605/g.33253  ORF Transcript_32605/g.33253 Transcript_32605/m.33253 type:complete len:380 (+) Transcript_32605:51-1190(+)|eukprot:CAMPEP_0182437944 /NCGR_PEP_ID=MMETSP1167-20130531/85394_1 /TAXON_ID=2988 /ORGANISM="Mallomonas Sp, Strain CCMP3275" /LENGTH=379 /DNA_ID=CAMNT_0024631051 /DNA_START=733 /DNA_END=1872 /DNA_ORIENTATION=-
MRLTSNNKKLLQSFHSYQNLIASEFRDSLPKITQNFIRDTGCLRFFLDTSATFTAISICLRRPVLALIHLQLILNVNNFQYGNSPAEFLDIHHVSIKDQLIADSGPVLVFVHGGAWGSGKPWMYRNIAYNLAASINASSVVIVGYPTYPCAGIPDQVKSVTNAIHFIKNSTSLLQTDDIHMKRKLILAGHSSGAHIGALALALSSPVDGVNPTLHSEETGIHDSHKHLVDGFIGIAGVYDIHKHYSWEAGRGLHEISPMKGSVESADKLVDYSPTIILRNRRTDTQEIPRDRRQHVFPPSLLIHGAGDVVVPSSSSEEFHDTLRDICPDIQTCIVDCDHLYPILHFLDDNDKTGADGEMVESIDAFCKRLYSNENTNNK